MDSRQIKRRSCVDGFDAAMRDRTAQNEGAKLIFARDIVDIFAAAAQEAQIFHARHRAADQTIRCSQLRFSRPVLRICALNPQSPLTVYSAPDSLPPIEIASVVVSKFASFPISRWGRTSKPKRH